MNIAFCIKMNLTQTSNPWWWIEEVSGDKPRGRTRKHIRLTEDEDDLEARIERTVKCLVPDIIQALLSSQNRPAAVSNDNSDISVTSGSGTIQAAGLAQMQLGNQSIAPNALSRKSDRPNRLPLTDAAVLPCSTRGLPSAKRNSRGSLTDLDALVQSYQLMALTDNTARVHNQGVRAFFNICMHYNLPVGGLPQMELMNTPYYTLQPTVHTI